MDGRPVEEAKALRSNEEGPRRRGHRVEMKRLPPGRVKDRSEEDEEEEEGEEDVIEEVVFT